MALILIDINPKIFFSGQYRVEAKVSILSRQNEIIYGYYWGGSHFFVWYAFISMKSNQMCYSLIILLCHNASSPDHIQCCPKRLRTSKDDKIDMQTCQNRQTFRVCYCYFLHVKLTHRNKFAHLVIYYLWGQVTFLDGFACGYPNHIPIIRLKSL